VVKNSSRLKKLLLCASVPLWLINFTFSSENILIIFYLTLEKTFSEPNLFWGKKVNKGDFR